MSDAVMYGIASLETSSSVSAAITLRARGPARFTAAYAPVTFRMRASRRPIGVPPRDPPLQGARVARRDGDEELVLGAPDDRPVVEDHPFVVEHRPVADPTDGEIGETVRVEALEELHRVRALDAEPAERAHVDQPHAAPHGGDLVLGARVVMRTAPVPRPHELRPGRDVPVVDRRLLAWGQPGAGQRAHLHGDPRRSRRGRCGLGERAARHGGRTAAARTTCTPSPDTGPS